MSSQRDAAKRFGKHRFFLKDTIRQQIDFSQTGQHRNLRPLPLQKPCPKDALRVDLPDGAEALSRLARLPVGDAITRRESVRDYGGQDLTLEELAALLWATQGVREVLGPACALRTVPSAGSRHAFETYLAVSRVDGLPAGMYRYLPFDGQLVRLYSDARIGRRASVACLRQAFVARAAVVFFWTAIPARMEWRYDLAAHKVIAIDAGHVGQNLYLACTGLGAGACTIAAYDQNACDELLRVDGEEEFAVYIASVGKT